MIPLKSVVTYLDSLLPADDYQEGAINGLQVETSGEIVKLVAFAVDAGLSVIEKATAADADLLVVHHGLFWGTEEPLCGSKGKKLERLFRSSCSLYASHLPLDGSKDVGNAVEMGKFFGLENLQPFFEHAGGPVGALGEVRKGASLDQFVQKSDELVGYSPPLALPFGKEKIYKVAVVTGSGSVALKRCAKEGIDLLLSGEPKQEAYHIAKEEGINALFVGHYASETFGVRALKRRLEQQFELQTLFIDEPTGI